MGDTLLNHGSLWVVYRHLPTPIMLFLSNLPKSVVAFPFYSLEKVIAQIEEIYDDKFASDQVDASDGVAREELVRISLSHICYSLTVQL